MVTPPLEALLLVGLGVVAGVVNTLAGGGSLLVLPALMAWGMPAAQANATNRLPVLLQTLTAAFTLRAVDAQPRKLVATAFVPACAGSVAGACLATVIPNAWLERIVPLAMLAFLVTLVAQPERWLAAHADRRPARAWIQIAVFAGVGLYGGFLQAGIGLFLTAAFAMAAGRDLIQSSRLKALVVAFLTMPALAIFLSQGLVVWEPGLLVALGSVVGGFLGSRLALRGGPRLIRWFLVVTVAALSIHALVT